MILRSGLSPLLANLGSRGCPDRLPLITQQQTSARVIVKTGFDPKRSFWKTGLSESGDDLAVYDARLAALLTESDIAWLHNGGGA